MIKKPTPRSTNKKKMKMVDTQMEFMKVCTAALKTQNNDDLSECDAIGMMIAKKLGRMDPIQMVYAE